jgi:hypothetical protein
MIAETLPKILAYIRAVDDQKRFEFRAIFLKLHLNLHPTNMTQIVKIFSASVFGATLPKPTDVNEVNVK